MRKCYLKLACFLPSLLLGACQTTTPHVHSKSNKAYAHNPKAAGYNVQLGLGYLKEGDTTRAKRKLLIALAQNSTSAETHDAMAYFLEQTGTPKRARTHYLKAIQLAPNKGAPLNNYGSFLCRQGQYQLAEHYFLQAIANPNYINTANAYENAGLCASLIPDWAKATNYLQKALDKEPNRVSTLYELSRVEAQQHHNVRAAHYIERYLALVGKYPSKAALQLALKLAQQLHHTKKARHYQHLLQSHFPQTKPTSM